MFQFLLNVVAVVVILYIAVNVFCLALAFLIYGCQVVFGVFAIVIEALKKV